MEKYSHISPISYETFSNIAYHANNPGVGMALEKHMKKIKLIDFRSGI